MSSTDATPPSDDLGPYALLRNRNLVRYLSGRFIATAGHQMFTMALGWEIYERTQSAFALGLVGLTLILPMYALTLPAGHFADNHSRKRIVTLTVAIVALMNLAFCVISLKQAPIVLTYLLLLVVSGARTFMGAAMASFMPQLVERQHFSKAVTWNGGLFQLSSIVGPSLAGLIIGWAEKINLLSKPGQLLSKENNWAASGTSLFSILEIRSNLCSVVLMLTLY